jgi:hypothetical protein
VAKVQIFVNDIKSNCMYEEIKGRLHLKTARYRLVQDILPSSVLTKNTQMKTMYMELIFPAVV